MTLAEMQAAYWGGSRDWQGMGFNSEDDMTEYMNFVGKPYYGTDDQGAAYTDPIGTLPPDQFAPNPDGTGNYMMTVTPGDQWYDALASAGTVAPDASGNYVLPTNQLAPALPGYGIGEADDMSTIGPMLAMMVAGGAAGAGVGGGVGDAALSGGAATGTTAGALPESYWSMTAQGAAPVTDAAAVNAGTLSTGGAAAGDAAGLAQMGQAAGLSGADLAAFVESGGALGSTAAGGGGIGLGALGSGAGLASTVASQAGSGGGGSGGQAPIISEGPGVTDYLSNIPGNVWQGLLQGGLGYLGAGQQADALENVYNQQSAIGAPYRNTLAASYQPGFNLWDQPGYAGAFNQSADAAARAVSAKSGNPYGSPGAMAEIQGSLMNNAFLPALANYRGQLGQFGNLGLNTSGQAALMGAQQAGSQLDAVGYGVGTALNPQPDWSKLFGGNQGMNLNIGGMPWGRR